MKTFVLLVAALFGLNVYRYGFWVTLESAWVLAGPMLLVVLAVVVVLLLYAAGERAYIFLSRFALNRYNVKGQK